jgi:3-dehydroquinate synthase
MASLRIEVRSTAGTYPVLIEDGLTGRLASALGSSRLKSRPFIVSNSTVWRLHGQALRQGLPDAEPVLVPDGERYKQLATVSRIYDALVRMGADRASVVVAAGGGVVGDMAGFAAATYMRGLPLVQVPTTLLAQVDSAIGGKVGVNHSQAKNLIGAFHPPVLVAIDPRLLATLPRREFRSGLYEVVKYGMIASRPLFETLTRDLPALFAREPAALLPVIEQACRIKAAVVESDEREQGGRRILNFGHTVGHALEAVTRYRRFRHGEAIAYGMLAAAEIAAGRGLLPAADREALRSLIAMLGPLPPVADLSVRPILDAVRHDKKTVGGRLHFVLTPAIGRAVIVTDVSAREIDGALRRLVRRG